MMLLPTGSSVRIHLAAGVTDMRTSSKQTFLHRLLVPRAVILDPAATLDTPDWLLYCTGIRSVDHAEEIPPII